MKGSLSWQLHLGKYQVASYYQVKLSRREPSIFHVHRSNWDISTFKFKIMHSICLLLVNHCNLFSKYSTHTLIYFWGTSFTCSVVGEVTAVSSFNDVISDKMCTWSYMVLSTFDLFLHLHVFSCIFWCPCWTASMALKLFLFSVTALMSNI